MDYLKIDSVEQVYHYNITAPGTVFRPRTIENGLQEVEIISRGYGVFTRDGIDMEVSPGSMLWYYPGETIHARADKKDPYHAYLFRFRIKRPCRTRPPFLSKWDDQSECHRFFHKALKIFHSSQSLQQPARKEFALCLYSRFYWESGMIAFGDDNKHHPALSKALRYIEANHNRNISADDVAQAANLSLSHLHALFRKHHNQSIKQTILHHRMQQAKTLLTISNHSIKEIAHACGFNSANNFCYFFRKATGTSPEKYRHIII